MPNSITYFRGNNNNLQRVFAESYVNLGLQYFVTILTLVTLQGSVYTHGRQYR